jgi:hypothetical protein
VDADEGRLGALAQGIRSHGRTGGGRGITETLRRGETLTSASNAWRRRNRPTILAAQGHKSQKTFRATGNRKDIPGRLPGYRS